MDGTIAFLTSDRAGLEAAIESLAEIPISEAEKAQRRQFLEENPDFVASDSFIDEPPNLGVLQGLLAGFEETYALAYGCRPWDPPSQHLPAGRGRQHYR